MILALLTGFWLLVLLSILAAGRIGKGVKVKGFKPLPPWSSPARARERARFWPAPILVRRGELKPVRFKVNLLAPKQGSLGFNAKAGRAWWIEEAFFEFPWEREQYLNERAERWHGEAVAEFEAADEGEREALMEIEADVIEEALRVPLTEREQRRQFFELDPVKDFEVGLVPVAAAIGIPVRTAAAWRRDWTRLGAPRYKGIKGELDAWLKDQRVLASDLAGCEAGKYDEIRDKLAWRAA